jgi:hypothetical protein
MNGERTPIGVGSPIAAVVGALAWIFGVFSAESGAVSFWQIFGSFTVAAVAAVVGLLFAATARREWAAISRFDRGAIALGAVGCAAVAFATVVYLLLLLMPWP